MTITLLTSPPATPPDPLSTVQVCQGVVGWAADGDRVAAAARHRGRERERPVREDGEVVAAVVPQHQARAGEAADGAADLVAVGRAGDRDAGDVGVGDRAGAGAAVDHAGLPGRRRLIGDRHRVGRAARKHRREGEAAARADREGRPAVERQLEAGAREPADGAADDVLVGAAVDGDRRDVGAADGAGRARHRARLRRAGRLGGDRDREARAAEHATSRTERAARRDRQVVAAAVPQGQPAAHQADDGAADLVVVGGAGDRHVGDGARRRSGRCRPRPCRSATATTAASAR